MAEIKDIIELYSKDSREFLKGSLITGQNFVGSNSIQLFSVLEPNPDSFKKYSCTFGYDTAAISIRPDDGFDPESFNPKNLYFISDWDKAASKITVSSLPFCSVEEKDSFEICFEVAYVVNRGEHSKKVLTPDVISKFLVKDYVFTFCGKQWIFVKEYSNSNNFDILGLGYKDSVVYDEGKHRYYLRKHMPSRFPNDHVLFQRQVKCIGFSSGIEFSEDSAAKQAYQEVMSEMKNGSGLIKLWNRYSELELKKSTDLRDAIGSIRYQVIISNSEYTRVKMEMNEQQKEAVASNEDTLLLSSMEVEHLKIEGKESKKPVPFKIKSIDKRACVFDFYDEYNLIPDEGTMRISTVGDESVDRRRKRAVNDMTIKPSILLRNTVLAIEGKAEAMVIEKRKEIKPVISGQTSRYLKEKFGFERLTDDQEEAVRIALNTPDIAIIQGPPGTGKSTVVAAICNRLIEDAEKKNSHNDKVILVSAFQNDTVEHIASKIETLGLPTVKVGKDIVGNITAEESLISVIRQRIDDSIHKLSPDKDMRRVSSRLTTIRDIFEKEKNISETKSRVEELINENKSILSDQLWEGWRRMFPIAQAKPGDKLLKIIKGLPTTAAAYSDDGYKKILKFQSLPGIELTDEENEFLDNAPLDGEEPAEDFLLKLAEIKNKYLESIFDEENDTGEGDYLSLESWFEKAIKFFIEYEESAAEKDNEVFMISVLKSLREDLEGNNGGIRDAIKEYGESIAATNQVAGGREMMEYNSISNVILEEAARSNPLDLLIPVTKASKRIILVGDQKQLPHLLENDIADEAVASMDTDEAGKGEARKKYEESLFGILFNNLSKINTPKRCVTLTKQFRMHPAIGDFISRLYYDGKLTPGMGFDAQAEVKKHNLNLPWAKDKVAVFCNVRKGKGLESGRKGKWRNAEAKRIVELLDELKTDPAFENLSVGIITFYSKQVESIFNECVKAGYAQQSDKDGSYSIAPDFRETPDHREKLRIGTVDSFQGKEFDIVILSAVRSNEIERTDENFRKVFGFLTLENRLNVAFSRAQRMIIVAGDGEMFSDEYAMRYVEGLYEFYMKFSKDLKYGSTI